MHQLNGQIRSKHVKTLRKRAEYLERVVADDAEFKKVFQAKELAAIKAVLLCAVKLPDEVADGVESS
jgi:hypothetical protein